MVVGFTTGMFELLQMPACESLQILSVSKERITSLAFNKKGDWIAGEK
jgi:periodic tryptophan protein 2